jgi:hypothetical protein
MEKVLRKVSVKDRLPEHGSYKYTELGELFLNSKNIWSDVGTSRVYCPEYWYEEVSLIDMLNIYPNVFKQLYEELVKERYEIAYKFVAKSILQNHFHGIEKVITKALKIAAGLEEK